MSLVSLVPATPLADGEAKGIVGRSEVLDTSSVGAACESIRALRRRPRVAYLQQPARRRDPEW